MKRYTFIIEPYERERIVIEESEELAHELLWQSLSQGEQDHVAYMECIDEQPATQEEYDLQFENGI